MLRRVYLFWFVCLETRQFIYMRILIHSLSCGNISGWMYIVYETVSMNFWLVCILTSLYINMLRYFVDLYASLRMHFSCK